MTVWLSQCLCPGRHAILACAVETSPVDTAHEASIIDALEHTLRGTVRDALTSRAINPHCGLCHAKADSWTYEARPTRFATLAEARPELERLEAEQAITRAMFGDIPRSD